MQIKKIIFCLLIASFAQAGTEMGNGGDAVLQSFQLRGLQLAWFLKEEQKIAAKFQIDADSLIQTIKSTELIGQDQLFLAGVEVDAINYPKDKKIEVSRSRWLAHGQDQSTLEKRIAFHEYLWIYGLDDSNYQISNLIILELEKKMSLVENPELHTLILRTLCEAIRRREYAQAHKMLTWGLDLNKNCEVDNVLSSTTPTPLFIALTNYTMAHEKQPEQDAKNELIRKLVVYGADANGTVDYQGVPIQYLRVASNTLRSVGYTVDVRNIKTLLEHGADPNSLSYDGTVFTGVLIDKWTYYGVENYDEIFSLFFTHGGDVNLRFNPKSGHIPGRNVAMIVAETPNVGPTLEKLLQSGKADWCAPFVDGAHIEPKSRPIDHLLPEYKQLFEKYNVSCP